MNNMNNYEKLVNKLKEVEEIKKDLEELSFIVSITSIWLWWRINSQYNEFLYWECNTKEEAIWKMISLIRKQPENKNNSILIELCSSTVKPLEERHLRMYCENKNIDMYTMTNWDIVINHSYVLTDLDDTKPFHQQDDKVYLEILNYLNNI